MASDEPSSERCWRISAWSRELGRGSIHNEALGSTLEFDGAVAMVDDFKIAETVSVQLARHLGGYRVLKIQPTYSRPNPAEHLAEPLPPRMTEACGEASRIFLECADHAGDALLTVSNSSEAKLALTLTSSDGRSEAGILSFEHPQYVQLPWSFHADDLALKPYRWSAFRAANSELCSAWCGIAPIAFVFAFEPRQYGEVVYYVVAADFEFCSKT